MHSKNYKYRNVLKQSSIFWDGGYKQTCKHAASNERITEDVLRSQLLLLATASTPPRS